MSTLFDGARPLAAQKWSTIFPLLITAIYLAGDAVMIMWSALSTKALDHSGNAPENLATQDLFQLDLRLIKFAEAASYQGRIERNHRRNESVGERINLGIKAAWRRSAHLPGSVDCSAVYFPFLGPPVERMPVGGGFVGNGTAGFGLELGFAGCGIKRR